MSWNTALLPEVACVPLQPPEALQEAAFVVLHCKVVCPPVETLVGVAVRDRVGAGVVGGGVTGGGAAATVTVNELLTGVAEPWHESANVVLAVSGPTACMPETGFAPLHP